MATAYSTSIDTRPPLEKLLYVATVPWRVALHERVRRPKV